MKIFFTCVCFLLASLMPAPSAASHSHGAGNPESSILSCVSCINRCQMYRNPENTTACVSGCIIACVIRF